MFSPAVGDRDPDDLRQNYSSALFPPSFYFDFLTQEDIQKKIGAEVQYVECSREVSRHFGTTGGVRLWLPYLQIRFQVSLHRLEIQNARTWLPQLGALANSRLKMLIWVRAHKIAL